MKNKEKIELLNEKINLLENFIIQASNLMEANDWHATDEEMIPFEELTDKLDEVQAKIDK